MENNTIEHLAAFLKNGGLAILAAGGSARLLIVTTSEEWRLGGMALGLLAAFLALAALISLLNLVASIVAAGVVQITTRSLSQFRFYAARKIVALVVGAGIAVAGFATVSPYDPRWGVLPVGIGLLVAKLPDAWAVLNEQSWFYRIFRSGNAPEAEFAQRYHLKEMAKPFRSTFRTKHGYCSDSLFIGTSTRETS